MPKKIESRFACVQVFPLFCVTLLLLYNHHLNLSSSNPSKAIEVFKAEMIFIFTGVI